jgi:adenine deaminase
MHSFSVSGQLIDIVARRIFPATIYIENGRIATITETETAGPTYILPGFVDAHIHIESSMLVPAAFAQAAVLHGTVATVSDPHEIANVCGLEGVRYMIENARLTNFKFFFGAPSCVPATTFETAGATLDAAAVEQLLQSEDIWYLSEMMNYPGVLYKDPEVMAKITAAHLAGKPVDGHAPGLRGEMARNYAAAGITTDHECFTLEEAVEKAELGMHILIREGSAAKNYNALHPILNKYPAQTMFCSDDKHPDELVLHHINAIVKRSLALGYDLFDVLHAACLNPVKHYKLPVGLLQPGDPADFIVVDNTTDFNILTTCINGVVVAENGLPNLSYSTVQPINNFNTDHKTPDQFRVKASGPQPVIRVIEALEGQLVTNELQLPALVQEGYIVSDTSRDILKMAVVNRYQPGIAPAMAFIKNFGLTTGAIASTVGHDCHNIIVVGVDDASICAAVNALIDEQGGISVVDNDGQVQVMPLPVAGLMGTGSAWDTAEAYTTVNKAAKALGTPLHAPFMTLSFMALLVIPALKLSDKGLFNGSSFSFTPLEL